MLPISAIQTAMPGVLPNFDAASPKISPLAPGEVAQPQEISSTQPADNSFSSLLGKMVSDVNTQQNTAAQTVSALQSGQAVPLHQAVIAMEEANVSFQLMVEVRNRLLDSYQEIMRMQI
jgi:flagellar hook-basal body complex protein FliE